MVSHTPIDEFLALKEFSSKKVAGPFHINGVVHVLVDVAVGEEDLSVERLISLKRNDFAIDRQGLFTFVFVFDIKIDLTREDWLSGLGVNDGPNGFVFEEDVAIIIENDGITREEEPFRWLWEGDDLNLLIISRDAVHLCGDSRDDPTPRVGSKITNIDDLKDFASNG